MTFSEKLKADLQRLLSFSGDVSFRRVSSWTVLRFSLSPRFLPVVLIRLSQIEVFRKTEVLAKMFSLLNYILFGIEVSLKAEIGAGLILPHTVGTVIGAKSIGSNVTIYHQVTLGAKAMDVGYNPDLRPVIGNDVVIGSGAKILGSVSVGDFAIVGANAVVTRSVPAGVLAVGVPAVWRKLT